MTPDNGTDVHRERVADALQALAGIHPQAPELSLLTEVLGSLGEDDGQEVAPRSEPFDRIALLQRLDPIIRARLEGTQRAQALILWTAKAEPGKLNARQNAAAEIAGRKGGGWRKDEWGALCLRVADAVLAESRQRSHRVSPDGPERSDPAEPDPTPLDPEARRDEQPKPRRRPSLMIAAALLATIGVAITIWILVSDEGEPTAAPPTTKPPTTPEGETRCIATVGEVTEDARPALVEAGQTMRSTVFDQRIRCAIGRVTSTKVPDGDRIYQEVLVAGEDDPTAVTITTGGDAVLLRSREWTYILTAEPPALEVDQNEIYGRLESRVEVDGGVILTFETDNVITYPFADGPEFFVYAPAAIYWTANGGHQGPIGWPRSDAYLEDGLFRQQFEGGYGVLGADGMISFTPVTAGEGLPPRDELPGRIIETISGGEKPTSWVITEDLELTWVEDEDTYYDCGGEAATLTDEPLPGSAITGLPFAGVAECEG